MVEHGSREARVGVRRGALALGRRASWCWPLLLLCALALPACGDDSPSTPEPGQGAEGGASGAPKEEGGRAGDGDKAPEGGQPPNGGQAPSGGNAAGDGSGDGGVSGSGSEHESGGASDPGGAGAGGEEAGNDGGANGGVATGGSPQLGEAGAGSDEGGSGSFAEGGTTSSGGSGDAGAGGQGDAGASAEPSVPKTHAELCPNATPGAGVPEPPGGATPVRLHPYYQYLESPIARSEDFGAVVAGELEVIENQPDELVGGIDAFESFNVSFEARLGENWPEWLGYSWQGGTWDSHYVTIKPGWLRRGTYHVSVPLYRIYTVPGTAITVADPYTLQILIHVRGLGFTADRLFVPHYLGDTLKPAKIMLAGRDTAWRVTDAPEWLRIATSEADSLAQLELELSPEASFEALGTGTNEGRLCVENVEGDAVSVPVYGLIERPSLRPLHTQRYLYSFASTEQLWSFTYVFTDLSEEVPWTVTSSEPWLKLDRDTGMTNEKLVLSVDPTDLPEGRHSAELIFSDPSGRNDGTRVVVYYLKELERFSSWRRGSANYTSMVSPISPHTLNVSPGVVATDIFTGESVTVTLPLVESAVISAETRRLYIEWIDGRTPRVDTYGWPDLSFIHSVEAAGSTVYGARGVVSAFGKEYLNMNNTVLSVVDGRTGPALRASPQRNYERLRVYDDGRILFGFYEYTDEPLPSGYRHWARSATAVCSNPLGEDRLACSDEAGTYLTIPQLPNFYPYSPPYFTHQGGVFLDDAHAGNPDYAFSAAGQPIALPQRLVRYAQAQFGDTILVDEHEAHALNYLFEPAPGSSSR
jgi:hypothetical protein